MNIPEGWKLVPVDPTDEMALAGMRATRQNPSTINGVPQYRAMLAAAPTPPASEGREWYARLRAGKQTAVQHYEEQPDGSIHALDPAASRQCQCWSKAKHDLHCRYCSAPLIHAISRETFYNDQGHSGTVCDMEKCQERADEDDARYGIPEREVLRRRHALKNPDGTP